MASGARAGASDAAVAGRGMPTDWSVITTNAVYL
jgi:hypothetical protein